MNKHGTHNTLYSQKRSVKNKTCWGHLNSYNWAQLISIWVSSITKLAVWLLASTLARSSYAWSDTSLVLDGVPTEPGQDVIEVRLWLTNGGLSRQMLAGFLLMRPFAWMTPLKWNCAHQGVHPQGSGASVPEDRGQVSEFGSGSYLAGASKC